MGVWGPEAFDNDAAIAMVDGGTLTASENHTIDHLDNLLNSVAHNGPIDEEREPAYAACEIIAAARGGRIYWHSESWPESDGRMTPFFPEEVDAFLKTDPVYSDEEAERAIEVVGILHDRAEDTADLTAASYRDALERTLERLRNPYAPWEPKPIVRGRLSSLADG